MPATARPTRRRRCTPTPFIRRVKAWLFLTDVAADAGPFTYVPGSHRLTPERLAWERRMSLAAGRSPTAENRQGSFRITPAANWRRWVCRRPASSLCRRTRSSWPTRSAFTRAARAPAARCGSKSGPMAGAVRFIPWAAFDPWTGTALARRSLAGWQFGDLLERVGVKRHRWRARSGVSAFDPA